MKDVENSLSLLISVLAQENNDAIFYKSAAKFDLPLLLNFFIKTLPNYDSEFGRKAGEVVEARLRRRMVRVRAMAGLTLALRPL